MGQQGTYPIGARTLAGTDTLTGVVTNATADVPLTQLAAYMSTAITPQAIPLGGVSIANFSMTAYTPDQRVPFTNTAPAGWNVGAGRKTVDFEFVSNGFFAAEPANHLAIVTRCDTDVITTDVRGAGAILGDLTWTGFDGDQAKFKPTTIMESWSRPHIALQRYLWPETTGPRNALLADGVRYRWVIETTVQPNVAGAYTRYRLYRQAQPTTKLAWDLLVDTGDVLDAFNISDMTKQGLVFGIAFTVVPAGWTIDFQNIKVTWGPCGNVVQDNSANLSKYGADLHGDLSVIDTARRFTAPTSDTGASLLGGYTFQCSTPDAATTFIVKPNGSATTANHLYSNNSTSSTTYQVVSIGMAGSTALLETFNRGVTDPQLGVNVGAANRVATFKATGLNMLGASKDIGQPAGFSVNITNWGGAVSSTFATTQTLNMENFCTLGFISNYLQTFGGMPAAYANATEDTLRPLYCLFSFLAKNLQDKKVL